MKIDYEPLMVIDWYYFTRAIAGNLKEFKDGIEEQRKVLKEASGYYWDNGIASFRYGIDTFKFMLSDFKSSWELSVWDASGSISLFTETIPSTSQAKREFMDMLTNVCNMWRKREMFCSDCGKVISYTENMSHSYFASVFCTDCWERKWKAIEAKENYN